MEYIFYKVGIAEYQNPSYEPGPELTSQDDPTREEVMELLEIQQPIYFENLEALYNNKHVIRVEEIEVGYTYWMLTPISIAYQAERIQMAKASIRTSINNKGGTITAEERLDKFAEYIDNIQVAKTEQEKTVSNPNFSAGDVVVTPDANKVLSKATVKKDANLVAGNIKDGVTLFGVTGDYEGEGGGLVENEIVEFTNTNLVVITLAIYSDGAGGPGHLTVAGSMSSNGANPTTLGSIPHWDDYGLWKYFYIFVDKTQYRYIRIDAPKDKAYYIKLNYNNLGIKETYPVLYDTWIDLNNVKGMLCEFQAYDWLVLV